MERVQYMRQEKAVEVSVTNPNARVSDIGVVSKLEKQVTLILREIIQMGLEDSDLANGVIQGRHVRNGRR